MCVHENSTNTLSHEYLTYKLAFRKSPHIALGYILKSSSSSSLCSKPVNARRCGSDKKTTALERNMSTQLIKLCRAKTWSLVEERCRDYPREALPNESCKAGDGTTVLAIAIRGGAPLTVIQSIVEANPSQLSVVHRRRGSIMHESLGQGASLKVIRYFLKAARDHSAIEVFSMKDELGRTVLHCLVLHAINAIGCPGTCWNIFQTVVLASPVAVRTMDCDGNTPLLLLLLHQDTHRQNSMHEAQIHRMVKLMLAACPGAATVCRKVQRHWPSQRCEAGTVGDGVPTPLTYAMLYGRSEETIELLLDASKRVGSDAGMTLVSRYHEVPLHMAASLRSSVSLLKMLVQRSPHSALVPDIHHLTPLDWLWIRHALDWCSSTLNPVSPSTRRYLEADFSQLHERASREETTQVSTILLETLWQRLRLVVPAAAVAGCKEPRFKQGEPWPMMHAICLTHTPLAMVRLVLRREGKKVLKKRDLRMGRLPLHYAATRSGYSARVPVGAMSERFQEISEPPAVLEILRESPKAARVADANGQLPLHIAIDTSGSLDKPHFESIQGLLSEYPDSLERRDGKTKLFPWMQASIAKGICVETAFSLLLKNPTLLSSFSSA